MSDSWVSPLEVDVETMRAMAARVSELVTTHLASLRNQPVRITLSRPEAKRLVATIARIAPEQGIGFEAALAELAERVLPYHAREPHPRFLGYVPSIPTFPSVLGDWLATGYNFFAGVWPIASGPNEIEIVVLDWFRQWLRMPNGTGGLLTSGGSTATLMAVVAARHASASHSGFTSTRRMVRSRRLRHEAQRCCAVSSARTRWCSTRTSGSSFPSSAAAFWRGNRRRSSRRFTSSRSTSRTSRRGTRRSTSPT